MIDTPRLALVVDATAERNAPAIEAFVRAGWIARTAHSRAAALSLLAEATYSAAVLYPGRMAGTGFDAVAAMRRQCRSLPIAVVLGAGRGPAADPRILWFGGRGDDESIHRTVVAACRSSARAARRRDQRVTLPIEPHELPDIAEPECNDFDDVTDVIRPAAARALRELGRAQLGEWMRVGR